MREIRRLHSRSDPRVSRGQIDELVIDILRTPDLHGDPRESTFGTVAPKQRVQGDQHDGGRDGMNRQAPVKQELTEEALVTPDRVTRPTAISGGPVAETVGLLTEAEGLPVKNEEGDRTVVPVKIKH